MLANDTTRLAPRVWLAPSRAAAANATSRSARECGWAAVMPAGSLTTGTSGISLPPLWYLAVMATSAMSLCVPGMSKLMLRWLLRTDDA